MGKKGKVGKQRKDRYYHLAKETGYRSRAAFKLIQLNRKFEFLQKSKVLIDLCAAPGGWLQVAQKYMPVSSIIVGVDLVPIKPIYNVITLQEDITTQKCRTVLTRELKTWKVDVVLNDGAPNVGRSWIHDAFEQNRLTLSALHLACDFLIKGGWFVTKVFRSKDYNALMWVFKKLFKRVHATKPQASRNESAEIFVVCQHFISPDKIDSRFFDPSYVFADVEQKEQRMNKGDLLKPIAKQKKAKAEGYADGDLVLHYKIDASEFVRSINYIELLSKTNQIILDSDDIKNNPLTTEEIVEYMKDLKVLGRKELIALMSWRQKIRHALFPKKDEDNLEEIKEIGDVEEDIEENDPEQSEEAQKLKRKKRKIAKEKRKIEERMSLKMVLKNDQLVEEEQELFDLKRIKKNSQLDSINQDTEPDDIEDDEQLEQKPRISKLSYDKDDTTAKYYDPDDSDNEEGLSGDENYENAEDLVELTNDDFEEYDNDNNCLVVDLEDKNDKLKNMTKMFFDNKIFNKNLGDDQLDDEDIELQELENRITKENNPSLPNENKAKVNFAAEIKTVSNVANTESDESDSDSEIDENEKDKASTNGSAMLSPEEMALASVMIKSKKNKRDVMNDAWNRYNHEDDNFLPSWFKKEEQVYYRKPIVVSNELAKDYNDRLKEINSRPIKKVMEAKARKKKRAIRRLEKARNKAETVTDNDDMTNTEKAQYIRSIYKKAVKNDKNKVQLVVGKRMYGNRRPPGVKGRYKIVDSRMKKDKRGEPKQTSKKQPKGKDKNKNNKRPKQGKGRK